MVVLTLLKRTYRATPAADSPLSRSGSNIMEPARLKKKAFSHVKTPDMKKLLENDSGEANYFSTVVFIFITVLLLAFIIDLFGIISNSRSPCAPVCPIL